MSGVIQYPISFNTIYFIIANNFSSYTDDVDTGGFGNTNGLTHAVSNINKEIWISVLASYLYSDIFAIGI